MLVGKTTTMEFAFGVPDPATGFPVPRNPWALERWSGGSSSGTANGVAAGLFLGGLGTDTGGSIRLPSAFCGITGLKPTRGLVPVDGLHPARADRSTTSARWHARPATALTCSPPSPDSPRTRRGTASPALARGRARASRRRPRASTRAPPGRSSTRSRRSSRLGARPPRSALPHYDADRGREPGRDAPRGVRRHRADSATAGTTTASTPAPDHARRVLHRRRRGLAPAPSPRSEGGLGGRAAARHDAIVALTAGGEPERSTSSSVESHLAAASLTFTRIWNPLGPPVVSVPVGFTPTACRSGMQIVGRSGGGRRLLGPRRPRSRWRTRAGIFGHPRWRCHRSGPPTAETANQGSLRASDPLDSAG